LGELSAQRIVQADQVFDALKVNRFISKKWGAGLMMRREGLTEMIRQAYLAEVQAMRMIHH